jgi:hypothetical protein
MASTLLTMLIVLVIFGVIWWLIETALPLPPTIRMVIRVVLVLFLCLWLLSLIGVVPRFGV